jgi:hypothetical protein
MAPVTRWRVRSFIDLNYELRLELNQPLPLGCMLAKELVNRIQVRL